MTMPAATAMSLTKPSPKSWNRAVFDDLRDIVGPESANRLLQAFYTDLCTRFADIGSHGAMRQDAHAITSTAGLFGFETLSHAAKTLETALMRGDGVGQSRIKLLDETRAVKDVLSDCLSLMTPA